MTSELITPDGEVVESEAAHGEPNCPPGVVSFGSSLYSS